MLVFDRIGKIDRIFDKILFILLILSGDFSLAHAPCRVMKAGRR